MLEISLGYAAVIVIALGVIFYVGGLCWLIRQTIKLKQSIRETKCGEHRFVFVKKHKSRIETMGCATAIRSQYHSPYYSFECSCGAATEIVEEGLSDEQAVALKVLGYRLPEYDIYRRRAKKHTEEKWAKKDGE